MEHTKELWRVETYPQCDSDILDCNDHSIINGSTGLIDDYETARRIVACVNACAGVDTELLEEYQAPFSELRKQRDELLAALIESRHALQFANDNPNGGISDTIWMMHGPETLFDFMDAAIAKAKEGAR